VLETSHRFVSCTLILVGNSDITRVLAVNGSDEFISCPSSENLLDYTHSDLLTKYSDKPT
jgi:hypothetical protein